MTGKRMYALIGAFAVLVIAGTVGVLVFGTGQKAPATDRRAEAVTRCEAAVKDRLKAPATARFSGISGDRPTGTSYQRFDLSGTVDAENSFGALVRSSWTCIVSYDSESGDWSDAYADVSSSQE